MVIMMMMLMITNIMTNTKNHNHNQGNNITVGTIMIINRGHGDMMMMINDYDLYTRRINLLDRFIGTAYNCL